MSIMKKKLVIGFSGPVKPLWSCPAIIAQDSPNISYPIVYFRKPKNVDRKEFDAAVQEIRRLLNEAVYTPSVEGVL